MIGHHGRLRPVALPRDGDRPPQSFYDFFVKRFVLRETQGRVDRRPPLDFAGEPPVDLDGQPPLQVLEQLPAAGPGRVPPAFGFLLEIRVRVFGQTEPIEKLGRSLRHLKETARPNI